MSTDVVDKHSSRKNIIGFYLKLLTFLKTMGKCRAPDDFGLNINNNSSKQLLVVFYFHG